MSRRRRGRRVLQARRRGHGQPRPVVRQARCSCTASSWTSRSDSARTRSTTGSRSRPATTSSTATYTGIVPDTFKDGAEVVLTGRLGPDGFQVEPNGVTAKCPSKYEADRAGDRAPRSRRTDAHGLTRLVPHPRGVRRRERRVRRVDRRRAAPAAVARSKAASASSTPSRRSCCVASAVMVHAFVTGDFSIKYVQRYSNAAQPLFYKLASYWGGLDGSIMFWVTLLALVRQRRGLRQSRAAPAADPVGRRDDLRRGDVLPLPDGGPQQPVRDVPDDGAGGRARA